jgi:hypothetical protein
MFFGETPKTAVETTALPKPTASFRLISDDIRALPRPMTKSKESAVLLIQFASLY